MKSRADQESSPAGIACAGRSFFPDENHGFIQRLEDASGASVGPCTDHPRQRGCEGTERTRTPYLERHQHGQGDSVSLANIGKTKRMQKIPGLPTDLAIWHVCVSVCCFGGTRFASRASNTPVRSGIVLKKPGEFFGYSSARCVPDLLIIFCVVVCASFDTSPAGIRMAASGVSSIIVPLSPDGTRFDATYSLYLSNRKPSVSPWLQKEELIALLLSNWASGVLPNHHLLQCLAGQAPC
jgi:hypothetical protein